MVRPLAAARLTDNFWGNEDALRMHRRKKKMHFRVLRLGGVDGHLIFILHPTHTGDIMDRA